MRSLFRLLAALFVLSAGLAHAAGPDLTEPLSATKADGKQPLEITAKQTLEWRRDDNQYVARGDVVAKQGDMSLSADTLTADYRDAKASGAKPTGKGGSGNGTIYRMTATGHVRIAANGSVATGDLAVYDVDKGLATMTGQHLEMRQADNQNVTARDRFEYWVDQGRLNAVGQAHAVRGGDTIDADTLSAIFQRNAQTNTRELTKLEANGHVVITTPDEILHSDKGDYTKATNIATMTGHVSIKRGRNLLEGDSADVNLDTNVSRMHGNQGPTGRVRGVFYPDSAPGKTTPPTSPSPVP